MAAAPAAAVTPDPQAILQAMKAATGGTAWDRIGEIRASGTFAGLGLSGTFATLSDTRSGYTKSTITAGKIEFGRGGDAQGAWMQSGGIVQATNGPGATKTAITAAYVARNGWWHPTTDPATFGYEGAKSENGHTFDVIVITPRGGDPLQLWIDPSTHLVFREIQTTDNHLNLITTLTNYRRVDGVLYPYAQRAGINGDPKYDSVQNVTSVEMLTQAVASDFTRPVSRAAASIPSKAAATVSFALSDVDTGHILLPVTIDGKGPYNMIFDSGGQNILTPQIARKLGIKSTGAVPIGGAGPKNVQAGLAQIGEMSIGNAHLNDQQFLVMPLPATLVNERHDLPIAGIVGFEMLKNFAITIDYGNRTMTLADPHAFTYTGKGTRLAFTTDGHAPLVHANLDGVEGTYWLDTGNGGGLILFDPFVKAHPQLDKARAGLHLVSPGGVGGTIPEFQTRFASLQLGPYVLRNVAASVTHQSQGGFASQTLAGDIGSQELRRFTVTLDYANGAVYLEPNAWMSKPMLGNRTGFNLVQPDARTLQVLSVARGTPAYEAGLRAGDVVVAVDGHSIVALGSSDVAMLMHRKQHVTLTVMRAGRRRNVSFELRDLLSSR